MSAPEADGQRAVIYVRFAENGNIRKWQSEPFPEGVRFVRQPEGEGHEDDCPMRGPAPNACCTCGNPRAEKYRP